MLFCSSSYYGYYDTRIDEKETAVYLSCRYHISIFEDILAILSLVRSEQLSDVMNFHVVSTESLLL